MSASSVWRNDGFRRVWAGQTASIFGDRVTDVALPFLILAETHAPFDAALVAAARYVPMVVLGLFAGVVVDRVSRRAVLIACDLARGLALAVIVALAALHHAASLWLLAGMLVVLGIGQLGFQAAYWAWLPDVLGEDLFGRGAAALEAADAASTLGGPAIGGVLVGAIGPALALGADAFSYFVSAGTLLTVRDTLPPPTPPPFAWGALWREVDEGLRAITHSPQQRLLKGLGAVVYISTGSIAVLLVVLGDVRLHLPAWQTGLILAAAGIGGLVGSASAARFLALPPMRALAGIFAVAAVGMGLLCIATFLTGGAAFILAFVANLILDGAVSLSFIITGTTSVLVTPRAVRGRVNGVSNLYASVMRGGGLLVAGALAAMGNPLPAFAAIGLAFAVAASTAGRTRVSFTAPDVL
ncbi:MAG: MFS transporter [Ktedonobacterales bacterium]|nr:MFS transporter [Ktedonobacterales bacterium]